MLEVKDATITVGGKTLVRGLSFMVRDGQLTCVTGAEHSGKTTLLRTLMGFLPVDEGFVSIDGELAYICELRGRRSEGDAVAAIVHESLVQQMMRMAVKHDIDAMGGSNQAA